MMHTAMRAIVVAALLVGPLGATAGTLRQVGAVQPTKDLGLPPAARNVRLVNQLPGTAGTISLNFVRYRSGEVLLVSSRDGLKSYDLTDRDRPKLLDHLTKQELALPGDDPTQDFWQNEDVDVDPRRKLVFMARERSAFGQWDRTGVYIISAADPRRLRVMSFAPMDTGHTTTCINRCSYLWTAGYDGAPITDPGPYQRSGKIFVTDIRDPARPRTSTTYVDLARHQGRTRMTHDVQVDAAGVAWVAGTGGTRGYHTSGLHRDPVSGRVRHATALRPIPYAGGGVPLADAPTTFTHNSVRPVGSTLRDGPKPSRRHPAGSLLLHTEEAFGSSTCQDQGKLVISSLRGSHDGQSWRSTPERPFYLRTVGTWSPHDGAGTQPGLFCSAHYFSMHKRILASSWYEQGTRFLDISDPTNPIQIAYWRPAGSTSFAPYWHRDRIYLVDMTLGVQILALDKGAHRAAAERREVRAPEFKPSSGSPIERRVPLKPHRVFGHACPMLVNRDACGPSGASCC